MAVVVAGMNMLYLDFAHAVVVCFVYSDRFVYFDAVRVLQNSNLENNQLDGTLPSSIGSLGNLKLL